MKDYKRYQSIIKRNLDYWMEIPVLEFTEELARLMDEKSVNQAELARRIGKSPAYISKVLNGNENFTLKTITKLALAVDSTVHLHLADKEAITQWKDLFVSGTDVFLYADFEENVEITLPTSYSTSSWFDESINDISYKEVVNG